MTVTVEEAPQKTTEPARLRMSYEEFLRWSDEDTHAEWVEGEVIVFMPAKDIHQVVSGRLYLLLSLFVRLFDLGQVRYAPFEVRIQPGRSSREPDLLFVAKENLNRLSEERLVGPPDLIVEIISADSVRRDRHEKFRDYERAGVREYWIIDPRPGKQRADFYHLDENGEYELFGTDDDEVVASRVLPGLGLRPVWLWQSGDFDPLAALTEMAQLPASLTTEYEEKLRTALRNLRKKNE